MFETQLQKFVLVDKYSRYNERLGRRETWEETVNRVTSFLTELSDGKLSQEDYDKIYELILNGTISPSMRLMATAGKAARKNHLLIYNCSYTPVTEIAVFAELLWLSMSAVGVGYSVENKYIKLLPPVIKMDSESKPIEHVIEDSAEGWVKAFSLGILCWWSGADVVFDYSQIRPAGAPLKTKGGTASGPQVLIDLMKSAKEIIQKNAGGKLSSVDVFDLITAIGYAAVSGGVRRSAQICLFDYDDKEMLNAKTGNFWEHHPNRVNANISAVWDKEMSYDEILAQMEIMFDGMSGEPGIVSRRSMNLTRPSWRRELVHGGLNPCQPEFATILTPDGIRTMGEAGIGDTIWSGHEWTKIVNKWSTGVKPVYKYTSSYGEFVGTENHKVFQNGHRTEVKDAKTIDAGTCELDDSTQIVFDYQTVMDGLVIGDGSVHKASNNLVYLCVGQDDYDYFTDPINDYLTKERKGLHENAWEVLTTISHEELPYTYERQIPDRFYHGDRNTVASFLRGLFSANGYCIGNRIGLKQTSLKLIKQAQEMLSFLGISSYVTQNKPSVIKWDNGEFESKASYDLNISSDRYEFMSLIGFIQDYKNQAVSGGVQRKKISSGIVQDVEYLGDYEVFDITVECESHSYWTGGLKVSNCAEVNLHGSTAGGRFGGQLCNLSSVNVQHNMTLEDLDEAVRYATIVGTIQATATDFKLLRKEWKEICEEERILGVSLVGFCDLELVRRPEVLEHLKQIAIDTNVEYASKLGINRAASVSCSKPAGSSSSMYGTARGINPRYSEYYERRVRVGAKTPVYRLMKDQGFDMRPENGQEDWDEPNVYVATFYEKSPDGAITVDDMDAMKQLELWLTVKKHWTTHNPSVTIEYTEEDRDKIVKWLFDNQDYVNGIAMLPRSDHVYLQAPYTKITKEEYERGIANEAELDWSQLYKYESTDSTVKDIECAGQMCDLF